MKSRKFFAVALATFTLAGLAYTGLAMARATHEARMGRRVQTALQKAGVDQARIDSILDQMRQYKPEIVSAWRQHKDLLGQIAAMSPQQASAVGAKVQELVALHAEKRERLHQALEELGASLSAREKAQLVLNLSERFSHPEVECGSRADRLMERLADHDVLGADEIASVQAQVDRALPQLCGLKEQLKSEMAALKAVVADKDAKDEAIVGVLERLKANRHAAGELRRELVGQAVVELSPATQISIAEKLLRVQRAAEVLIGL